MNTGSKILFLVVAFFVLAALLFLLSQQSVDGREAVIVSILLTLLSVGATWIFAAYNREDSTEKAIAEVKQLNDEKLRRYASKAAEKVTNLSNLLDQVAETLQDASSSAEYDEVGFSILVERAQSTIQMIKMLRSMNDTSLSDWEGVIDEELEMRRREREESQEELRASIAELQDSLLSLEQQARSLGDQSSGLVSLNELEEIRNEVRQAILQLSGRPSVRTPHKKKLQCVRCGCLIPIKIRRNGKIRTRAATCGNCGLMQVVAGKTASDAELAIREPIEEAIFCPDCGSNQAVSLDNAPGSSVSHNCINCGTTLNIFRKVEGVAVKVRNASIITTSENPNAELVEKVRQELPKQPWPSGIHKEIAVRLGVTNTSVQKCIRILISEGTVHHQIDGKILVPMEEDEKESTVLDPSLKNSIEDQPDSKN